nr:hypothetical protein [Tanacetum cinerariifolium]
MNYKSVVARNQTNGIAGTKENIDVGQAEKKTVPYQEYILLPLWTKDTLVSSILKQSLDDSFQPSKEKEIKGAGAPGNKDGDVLSPDVLKIHQEKDATDNNTNNIPTVSLNVNAAGLQDNAVDEDIVWRLLKIP